MQAAARKYFTDAGLIVTTLSKEQLPEGIDRAPALGTVAPAAVFTSALPAPASVPGRQAAARQPAHPGGAQPRVVLQISVLPQVDAKLLFAVGSAHDPAGKEGLAALTAAMIARGGSKAMTIDQIDAALYPIAGTFTDHVDKEMTTFTAIVHHDQASTFFNTVLPQLLDPGFREEDFTRLKAAQLNALTQDLRAEQRRRAWKGAAADQYLPRHAVRPRRARHGGRHQCDHARRREAVREVDVYAWPT